MTEKRPLVLKNIVINYFIVTLPRYSWIFFWYLDISTFSFDVHY